MKRLVFVFLLLVLVFALCSCGGGGGGSSATNDPEANFEALWQDIDQYYSHFVVKKDIDWNAVYDEFRPRVTKDTGERDLFAIMSAMLERLKDGHVTLSSPYGTYMYEGWWTGYPLNFNFDLVKEHYLPNYKTAQNGNFVYGTINGQFGYLHIQSFQGDITSWNRDFDNILETFKELEGVVIDVRGNMGGNSSLGNAIAGRFTKEELISSYVRYRNPGADHNSFTEPEPHSFKPRGVWQFLKPVAVLFSLLI